MDHTIPHANPMIARYVEARVEAIEQRLEHWDDKVSELVRTLLPEGHCTIERVAEHFASTGAPSIVICWSAAPPLPKSSTPSAPT